MPNQNDLLEAALNYAKNGWLVFPCHSIEHTPLDSRKASNGLGGFYLATTDENQIRKWWKQWPDAAIALRTGKESGVFAVDVDPRHYGNTSIEELEAEHEPLPETVESETGGGGRHIFFRWPGQEVKCSTGAIAPGIDIKGDGGYVILPPSNHKSGNTYNWLFDQEPGECEIAKAPAWLLDKIVRKHKSGDSNVALPESQSITTTSVSIPEGHRNESLTRWVGSMRRTGLEAEEINAALQKTNKKRCQPPLSELEVEGIVRSVCRYDPDRATKAYMECLPDIRLGYGASELGAPVFRRMDDIEIEDIDWMWRGFLAGGKLSMFSGNPGTGKSTIAVDLAARVSRGGDWPDGSPGCKPGSVILLSKEDAPEDTIKPRLQLAGADMSKLYVLEGVKKANSNGKEIIEGDFNLDRDLETLEQMLKTIPDCRLVVIDPIGNYMGEANSHNDAAVRGVLGPLAKLGMKYDVAVLAIAHMNKDSDKAAIYRTLGSVGFVGIARMAYGAFLDDKDPTKKRRFLLPIKSNIGSDRTGLAYSIEVEVVGKTDHAKIAWEPEPVTENIDELFNRKPKGENDDADMSGIVGESPQAEKLAEAVEWLVWRLSSGERSKQEVLTCARKDGISSGTLERAKKELRIQPRKQGFGTAGSWFWSLPETINPSEFLGDDWQDQLENHHADDADPTVSTEDETPKMFNDSPPPGGIPGEIGFACAS